MSVSGALAFTLSGGLLTLNLVSTALVLNRFRGNSRHLASPEPISFIVIIAGLPPDEARPAMSALALAERGHEVIFCSDGAVPLPAALAEDVQSRGGRMVIKPCPPSANPKVDMMAAGLAAARHDIVACLDGNVIIPADLDERISGAIRKDPFVITTAPIAVGGEGLWGGMEEALISRLYGRWCIAAETLGVPVVFGKLLVFRKSWFAKAGGPARLLDAVAEDTALARMAKSTGARISQVWPPLATSLTGRTRRVILDRAGRWMQIRRHDVPLVYLAEGLLGFSSLMLAGTATALLLGWPLWLTLTLIAGIWHISEAMLARTMPGGWQPIIHVHALLRDLVFPVLWVRNLFPARYAWRKRTAR